ncbi:MinD superfamily P-loop ATPase, contains an inserted ferredoxin domain [Desulfocicer vacuolatum DSM 3385]|uniref:MinD superfamily P-loop ATPase, contains an inserted ferredoxin domain n=2 Tax=Desulfocicer vacuolatum TaxID=2298 RepID=A0A1W2A5L5_9BACT|nr:MinD superfamily P-loop ATPase, contains an inserted ferredoxin domain [Desulfocicer vacuolatum DSM 3385]
MIITIASGKGGTGKTTVTVNLAASINRDDVTVFDCDVEEPNSHIFIKPENISSEPISVMVPKVDTQRCTLCGACEEICQFSAITLVAKRIMTFPEMCHSCRGCEMVCPEDAVKEDSRVLGSVHQGKNARGIDLTWGELRVGEAMSPPLISQVKDRINPGGIALVDAPPGTSCPAIEALRSSDYALLVAEPTPFGLNDLALTVEALKKLKVPTGIVINRADDAPGIVEEYAKKEGIEILQRFPFSREAASICSRGKLLVNEMPEMKALFQQLFNRLNQLLTESKEAGEVGK